MTDREILLHLIGYCSSLEGYGVDLIEKKVDCLIANGVTVKKHGEWIDVGYKIRCSACDHGVFLGTEDPKVHTYEKANFKYCPNCGANMDLEEEMTNDQD